MRNLLFSPSIKATNRFRSTRRQGTAARSSPSGARASNVQAIPVSEPARGKVQSADGIGHGGLGIGHQFFDAFRPQSLSRPLDEQSDPQPRPSGTRASQRHDGELWVLGDKSRTLQRAASENTSARKSRGRSWEVEVPAGRSGRRAAMTVFHLANKSGRRRLWLLRPATRPPQGSSPPSDTSAGPRSHRRQSGMVAGC